MAATKDRVVNGTKGLKQQVQINKATGNNIQKIRCPKCKELANPRPDGKGGTILHCPTCKQSFKFQTM